MNQTVADTFRKLAETIPVPSSDSKPEVHQYRYVTIVQTQLSDSGKTKIFTVFSRESWAPLGYVRFFPKWRKYAFMPVESTVFEEICLRDIAEFIERQSRIWRMQRRKP